MTQTPFSIDVARIEVEGEDKSQGFIFITNPVGMPLTNQQLVDALSEYLLMETYERYITPKEELEVGH